MTFPIADVQIINVPLYSIFSIHIEMKGRLTVLYVHSYNMHVYNYLYACLQNLTKLYYVHRSTPPAMCLSRPRKQGCAHIMI